MHPHFTPRFGAAVIVVLTAVTSFVVAPAADADEAVRLAAGDRGAMVFELQTKLRGEGHDPGPIDGVFGTRTDSAVRSFQSAHALGVTGVVDGATWSALGGASAVPLLTIGSRGAAVLDLQRRLIGAGYDPGPIDGAFGARTAAAVGRFQTAEGLPASGAVDQTTWDRLAAASVLFGPGARGTGVVEIQTRLAALGFSPGPADGKYGQRTATAMKAFQTSAALPVTGVTDAATLAALRAADAGPGDTVLRRGDEGAAVLAFQTRLARVGFGPGTLDGKFGARTETAVARFQTAFNLPGAGVVNQATLNRLAAFERDVDRGYAAGYVPGAGAEQWRGLIAQVFARWGLDQQVCADPAGPSTCVPAQIDAAIKIISCESNGIPFAVNVSSGVTGLFQHRLTYWAERVKRVQAQFPDFPADASPFNPEHNAMVAGLLVWESRGALLRKLAAGGTTADGPSPWSHWSCKRVLG
ncbi:MAG: peptidoglycan-binding protein [Actinomycetota bacterium]